MTIEELYGKILADEGLKAALGEAAQAGKVVEWAASQGVEATEEELFAYAKAAAVKSDELTDEELDRVSGGGYWTFLASMASHSN